MFKKLHLPTAACASLALALSLAGCGGSSAPAATSLGGMAMAGPFLTGQACAYKVVGGAKDALLGTCANLASSAFNIDIGNYTGDVLIEIRAGATYDDEANPNDNVTGTALTGNLRTLINVATTGGSVNLAVTPLTEAAIRMAGATLNNTNVQAAIAQLAALLPTVTGLDLRTTLPVTTTNLGLAYREALRALSQLQWNTATGTYQGQLANYLTYLTGQIGTNGNTVGADLLTQIGSGLNSNCSVTNGALSCTVATGGGGGGGTTGGGSATLTASNATPSSGNGSLQISSITVTNAGGSYTDSNRISATGTVNGAPVEVKVYYTIASGTVWNISYGWAGSAGMLTNNAFCSPQTTPAICNASISGTTLTLSMPHLSDGAGTTAMLNGSITSADIVVGGSSGGGTTPMVSSYTPSSGAVGSTVTISGTNLDSFTPAPLVKFGTTTATASSATATSIVVTVPAGLAVGSSAITLSNADGSGSVSVGNFTVTAAAGGGGVGSTGTQMGGSIQGTALSLTGSVSTLAGSGAMSSTDGTGTAASMAFPSGITTDGTNLYFVDMFSKVRKVVIATGAVTTLAGTGTPGLVDATGTAAKFWAPFDLTTDGTNLYVADTQNNRIRKIVIATGVVTTLAGGGVGTSTDGIGSAASFNAPKSITTDGINLYVADTNSHLIRKVVIATGAVTTLAGSGSLGQANGIGTAASFNQPKGITLVGGNLYVTDVNSLVRKIVVATGEVSTFAGETVNTGPLTGADGTGTGARFNLPTGITSDGTSLYVSDTGYNAIRKIVIASGVVTTIATGLNNPYGITTDGSGLFVADYNANLIKMIQ